MEKKTDVPMNNALLLVQVLEGLGDLDDDVARQVLAEVGELHDLVEELAAGGQLQDDVVVLLGFGEFEKANDVGVVEFAHNRDLFEDVGALDFGLECGTNAVMKSWSEAEGRGDEEILGKERKWRRIKHSNAVKRRDGGKVVRKDEERQTTGKRHRDMMRNTCGAVE